MAPQKVLDIETLRSLAIEQSEECFHVSSESDGAGSHYVLYLVEGSVNVDNVMQALVETKIRRCILVLMNKASVQHKIDSEILA